MSTRADIAPVRVRVPQRFWVGLIAIIVYVALAAGVANLLAAWLQPADPIAEFALLHLPVLIPLVVAGLFFVRWSGWSADVWRTPSAFDTQPRRWWMLIIPVLLLANSVVLLSTVPSAELQLGPIVLIALVTALVGLGEELYFRGILRVSLRANHGETLTLIVTSLLFGLAHTFGSLFLGLSVGFIAFQIAITALSGALYYAAFRATGYLWVPILLHALDDFSLFVSGGDLTGGSGTVDVSPANTVIQGVLWALVVVILISCIRQDRATRKAAKPSELSVSR